MKSKFKRLLFKFLDVFVNTNFIEYYQEVSREDFIPKLKLAIELYMFFDEEIGKKIIDNRLIRDNKFYEDSHDIITNLNLEKKDLEAKLNEITSTYNEILDIKSSNEKKLAEIVDYYNSLNFEELSPDSMMLTIKELNLTNSQLIGQLNISKLLNEEQEKNVIEMRNTIKELGTINSEYKSSIKELERDASNLFTITSSILGISSKSDDDVKEVINKYKKMARENKSLKGTLTMFLEEIIGFNNAFGVHAPDKNVNSLEMAISSHGDLDIRDALKFELKLIDNKLAELYKVNTLAKAEIASLILTYDKSISYIEPIVNSKILAIRDSNINLSDNLSSLYKAGITRIFKQVENENNDDKDDDIKNLEDLFGLNNKITKASDIYDGHASITRYFSDLSRFYYVCKKQFRLPDNDIELDIEFVRELGSIFKLIEKLDFESDDWDITPQSLLGIDLMKILKRQKIEFNDIKSSLTDERIENRKLKDSISELKRDHFSEMLKLKDENDELIRFITEKINEHIAQQSETDVKTALEFDILKSELKIKEKKIIDIKLELNSKIEEIASMNAKISEMTDTISDLTEELEYIKIQFKSLNSTIIFLMNFKSDKEKIDKLRDEMREFIGELAYLVEGAYDYHFDFKFGRYVFIQKSNYHRALDKYPKIGIIENGYKRANDLITALDVMYEAALFLAQRIIITDNNYPRKKRRYEYAPIS